MTTIFKEGSSQNYLWRISKGIIYLSRNGSTVSKLEQGDVFGIEALLGDTKTPYTAESHGIEGVSVYKIPISSVLQLFGYQPVLSFRFYSNLSVDFANKLVLDLLQLSITKLSTKQARMKLARSIASISSFKRSISSLANNRNLPYSSETGAIASFECFVSNNSGVLHIFPDFLSFQEKKNVLNIKFNEIKTLDQNWAKTEELSIYDFSIVFFTQKKEEKITVCSFLFLYLKFSH